MKLVRLEGSRGALYINPGNLNSICPKAGGGSALFFIGDDEDEPIRVAAEPADIAAAIERATGGDPLAGDGSGSPLPPFDGTAEREAGATEDAPGEIPLAAGQEWDNPIDAFRSAAKVERLDNGGVYYTYTTTDGREHAGFRVIPLFRERYPRLISPAPEAETHPTESPVALLAGGSRCRFVRDAGALGGRFDAKVDAAVRSESSGETFRGVVTRAGMHAHELCTGKHIYAARAAAEIMSLLAVLGYRFDGVAGEGDESR